MTYAHRARRGPYQLHRSCFESFRELKLSSVSTVTRSHVLPFACARMFRRERASRTQTRMRARSACSCRLKRARYLAGGNLFYIRGELRGRARR